MLAKVYEMDGMTVIVHLEAVPVCGQDFCESCGDCLHCFGGQECYRGGNHWWVVSDERAALLMATSRPFGS